MCVRILWLIVGCLFLGGGSLTATTLAPDDDYDPTNPAEPQSVNICRIKVSADPAEGAYVSGSGKYDANGGSVYISTSANNTVDYTYTFLYWTLNGEQTSYSQSFWFTPVKGTFNFVAHYQKSEVEFDPANPTEPSSGNISRKYYLYLTSNLEGACSFNMASGNKVKEQTQLYIEAYPNPDYQFEGWKKDGQVISTNRYLYFTMPSANTTLEACFSEIPFDPENPQEPSGPSGDVDNSTRKIINVAIGSGNTVIDKTRIVINEEKTLGYDTGADAAKFISNDADYQIYSLDGDNTKYSINERPEADGVIPLGILVKNAGSGTISATRLDCSAYLIDNEKGITHDLAVGGYTFNSSAGAFDSRFTIDLSPNFVKGDANGDGKVDITDAKCIVNYLVGKPNTSFLSVAADANCDGVVDIADAVCIVNFVVGNISALAPRLDGNMQGSE